MIKRTGIFAGYFKVYNMLNMSINVSGTGFPPDNLKEG